MRTMGTMRMVETMCVMAIVMGIIGAMCSCSDGSDANLNPNLNLDGNYAGQSKTVKFAVGGDFTMSTEIMGKGSLTADGKAMTDLWVLDYKGGELVQQLHQVSGDADFGEPQMTLDFGAHHIYFVASRGNEPTLSTDDHIISWVKASDTFYKDYALTVNNETQAAQGVTLERRATKVRFTMEDAIPLNTATINMTASKWYTSLDYLTGEPVNGVEKTLPITVSNSYLGQTGQSASFFSLSGTEEWTTNVTVITRKSDASIISQVQINSVPLKANRSTNYTGRLFEQSPSFALTLNGTWKDDLELNF